MFAVMFDPLLSADRKHFNCETTLINNKGHAVVMLSTYMSKAFDSLHLNLLPAKLKAYGLSNLALRPMQSYFSNREKTEQE